MSERLAALAFLAASGLYLAGALAFPLGTGARPGAGFFPVGIGVFLCAIAACFVAAVHRRVPAASTETSASPMAADALARVAVTAAGLVGFCLFLPWTGYPAAAFGFVALLLKGLGRGGWAGALVAAALCASLSYYVFGVLLSVPLPRGVLFG